MSKFNGPMKGKHIILKSLDRTNSLAAKPVPGGFDYWKGYTYEIKDHFISTYLCAFLIKHPIAKHEIFVHIDDCEIISSKDSFSEKYSEKGQFEFNFACPSTAGPERNIERKCCDSPNVILNSAFGEDFYVCKNCKTEVIDIEGTLLC